ncbi:MAG: polysaccharide biosynthesis protein PslG [Cryptosporangiaceae bacterium]|jgi:hypothetical protein|nr:polysaccharide biosynthesis protein PslG [Cryptosporangiaceae bacterium]
MLTHRPRTPLATRFSRIGLAAVTAALVGSALALNGAAAAHAADVPPAPRATTAKVAFGTQFHGTWAELSDDDKAKILDTVAAAGATWVRIDISWSMIQPKKGTFDTVWGVPQVDKAVQMANARGLKVLGTFWLTPQWASGSTNSRVLPTNVADYANAIKFAANRWAGQIQAWEVWNEPNSSDFLSPVDPAAYTNLLKAAYPAVKAGSPTAQVMPGGTMYVDTNFISSVYANGGKNFFDVMAVHPYQGKADLPPDAPDTGGTTIQRLTHLDALETLMAANGDGAKPIWMTEFGWSTHDNTASTPTWYLGVSEATQAVYLKQSLEYIQANYPQITNAFWYTSRDLNVDGAYHQNNRGLIRRDFTPKPALQMVTCYIKGCQADAWVQATGAGSAGASTLEVKTSKDSRYTRRAYLRLDTSTALKHVSSAKLRMYVTSKDATTNVPVTAYPVADNTWADTGLTWPGPALGAAGGTVTVGATGTYYDFDVTDAVNADLTSDGIVSIALADPATADVRVQFASLEATNTATRPQLILTP